MCIRDRSSHLPRRTCRVHRQHPDFPRLAVSTPLSSSAVRLVIARCIVDYEGRLTAHLPEAVRLIMVKADGCVAVHADGGAYKPLNWMNSPNTLIEDESGWTVRNPKGEQLRIMLLEVLSDSEYTMGVAPSQGSVLIAGPQNGDIIADPDELLIMPDYSPTISWNNLSSSNLEIQLSSSEDFRSVDDESRVWNSWDDSNAFSMSSREFTTPAGEANLLNGTWVHFRMRSTNNSILGPWVSGFFGLPAEIGELDGQEATIELSNDTVNLGFGTLHDTWVMDGNTTYNGDEDIRMRIGHSNDSSEGNMHAFIRVNMEQVPIHDNVTIHEATLNVRRTSNAVGEPMISAWMMHSNLSLIHI